MKFILTESESESREKDRAAKLKNVSISQPNSSLQRDRWPAELEGDLPWTASVEGEGGGGTVEKWALKMQQLQLRKMRLESPVWPVLTRLESRVQRGACEFQVGGSDAQQILLAVSHHHPLHDGRLQGERETSTNAEGKSETLPKRDRWRLAI